VKLITVAESPVVPGAQSLDAHRLFASPDIEVVHIHLPAGKALVRHAASVDTLFYVIAGTATVESDAGTVQAPAGTLVPHPRETFHRVINETADRLEFLVIKTPRPTRPPVFDEQDH
jgi:mannose-6-phosphate isomerase-like protein (cupin superfamily)